MPKELSKRFAFFEFLQESLRNSWKRTLLSVFVLIGFITPNVVFANSFENDETGYMAYVVDDADLLSSSEEADLLKEIEAITEYGGVAFISIDRNSNSTKYYAEELYRDYFGKDSGTLFLIDMDNREIYIFSDGDIYNTITTDYAQTITDNVYTYASDEEYYECASKAFEQILRLLEGKWIAQPMKYICNAFLAVAIALLINYFVVMMLSRSRKASASQLINSIYSKVDVNNARADFTHQTKRYSPQSSGSSGGGGRSSGGGGGSSGGGGGHRF